MTGNRRILVVDDDPIVQRSCERILGESYEVEVAPTGREGLGKLSSGRYDLALVDLKLPDVSGLDILREAPDRFPDVPIVIITGYSTIKSAVEAVKLGAFDYVAKPFTPDEIETVVAKGLARRSLLEERRELKEALSGRYDISQIIGDSPATRRVKDLIAQVALTDSTVLITGESGTGKDLVARAIHHSSQRREARFLAVDCGAIAPTLLASELFGHVRGAFTGADEDRRGLIRSADGGTLFLDEVANLPLELQPVLLRTIETREVRPVGAAEGLKVDVRYIAATNCDLAELVRKKKFRADLFYRLNVFPIHIPPLRERREDIPALARHFLAKFAAAMHTRVEEFTPEALDALCRYDWPGNVRELSNVIERLVIRSEQARVGHVHVKESLPPARRPAAVPRTAAELNDLRKRLRQEAGAEVEKLFVLDALRRNDYNVTRAAAETGMQRSNFHALLRKHGLRIRDILTQ